MCNDLNAPDKKKDNKTGLKNSNKPSSEKIDNPVKTSLSTFDWFSFILQYLAAK